MRVGRVAVMVSVALGGVLGVFWVLRSSAWENTTVPIEMDRMDSVPISSDSRRAIRLGGALSPTDVITSYFPLIFYSYEPRLDPDDPEYVNGVQWGLVKVEAPYAWAVSTGEGLLVAIVDTGIDPDHPDLRDKLWVNLPELNGESGADDDGNGKVDDIYGWDFVAGDNEPRDANGHGTHVAGIAGAMTDNGLGVAGMGWNAILIPIRVLGEDGTGDSWDVARGIRYAADCGAKIINLSLGAPGYSQSSPYPALRDAVLYAQSKGALVVAAAGNEGYPPGSAYYFYPAAYADVLGVAATTRHDGIASFSNAGPYVDVAAPGVDIYSTKPFSSYGSMQGTSMATPLVSGLAALVWARHPSATALQVAALIMDGAEDLGSVGRDPYFGWGRINARNSLYATPGAESEMTLGSDSMPADSMISFGEGRLHVNLRSGELLVRLHSSLSRQQGYDVFAAHRLPVLGADLRANLYLIRVEKGQEYATALALQWDANVVYAQPNYVLSAAYGDY